SRIIGRRSRKEVCVELDNYVNLITVKDEPSDDDFVDMGGKSANASVLKRSGGNKEKAVDGANKDKTVASDCNGNIDTKNKNRKEQDTQLGSKEKTKPLLVNLDVLRNRNRKQLKSTW
ncbi:hypothetical protein Tco_0867542, partial [Tanacetum coccineum]